MPKVSEQTLGDAGAAKAFAGFPGAWLDELNIIAGGLGDAVQKLADTVSSYQHNEQQVANSFTGPPWSATQSTPVSVVPSAVPADQNDADVSGVPSAVPAS